MKRWYVVETQPRAEDKAMHHLVRQGYEAYLPQYLKRRSHARKVDWIPTPLFPRYLFVALDVDLDQWSPISSTVGVKRMIFHGATPAPVPFGIIEGVQAREDERGLVQFETSEKFKR